MTKKVVRKKKGKRKPANGDYPEKYDALIHYTLRYDPSATEPYCRCTGCKTNVIELLVIDHKKKRTKKEKGLAGKSLYEYLKKNKRSLNDYSSEGALEFWSSGGLMQEIKPSGRPESFDSYNLTFKHIEVIILVPGKAAVAMYYSEGSMKPKGLPSVSQYMTRVTQAFVKEGDGWRIRATHWSPLTGGSGTSQANTN